jgi:hypothetical protein
MTALSAIKEAMSPERNLGVYSVERRVKFGEQIPEVKGICDGGEKMKIKNFLGGILAILLIWCAICAIKPFWDKYWLGQDLKAAATYGTKHSVKDTRKHLSRMMEQEEYGFSGEDFYIEKDSNNDTTIGIVYDDEIRIFGFTIIELEMEVEETRSEIKATF